MTSWAATVAGAALCGLGGALTPYLIRRLPEPPPDPEPEEGVELTAVQKARLEEPPKELYAVLGAQRWVPVTAAAVSAVAGALVGWELGWDWLLLLLWPLVPIGAALGIIDARTRLLPAIVVLPATWAALVFGLIRWPLTGSPDELVRGLVAMLVVRTVFWVLWWLRQAGMGFGDVRLSALLGLCLGYVGWAPVVVGLYGAFLGFAVPGLVVALVKRDRSILRKGYPFGPFLLAGAVIGLVWGQPVWDALYG